MAGGSGIMRWSVVFATSNVCLRASHRACVTQQERQTLYMNVDKYS